jgi:hypothetical protein
MNLGTHMPDGERRKPIDIEVCRSKVKVTTSKNRTKIRYFFCFRTISQERNVLSKCRSWDIVRKQNKYLIFVLFLEVVTLTFVLQTSISIGFLLSPSGMCVPSFISIQHFLLTILCGNKKSIKSLFYFWEEEAYWYWGS